MAHTTHQPVGRRKTLYAQGMTEDSRRRVGRPADEPDARDRIMAAAIAEFSRNGFNGTSLERIAQGAGLSKAGVLHHFGSKAAIPFAFLGDRDDVGLRLTEHEADFPEVLTSLVTVARRDVAASTETRVYAVLSGEAVGIDSPLRPWFQQRYAALQRQVAGGLRRALDGGRLREGVDVDAAAAEALAVMDGLQLQYLLDDDADTYLARFAAYIDRLVVSLSA